MELVSHIDANQDGVVDWPEFINFYTRVSCSFKDNFVFEKFVKQNWGLYKEPAYTHMRRYEVKV